MAATSRWRASSCPAEAGQRKGVLFITIEDETGIANGICGRIVSRRSIAQ
jgi:hypothetical protein